MADDAVADRWNDLSPEQQSLAAFAAVMRNATAPGLTELFWPETQRTRSFGWRLKALGAHGLGKLLVCVSGNAAPNLLVRLYLCRQCERIAAERDALWDAAAAYALAHDLLPLRVVGGAQ